MSSQNRPSAGSPITGSQQSKTNAFHRTQTDHAHARPNPGMLFFLYGANSQELTMDHLMLNGDVQNLVASLPPQAHVERKILIARIKEIVEKRPSLVRSFINPGASSEGNEVELASCVVSRMAELLSEIGDADHHQFDTEGKIQDDAQRRLFSSRLNALRRRVAQNHYNLSNGIPTKPYEVPEAFLDADTPRAEEYNLLAELHYCQGQLSGELLDANGPTKTEIIDEVKRWDVDGVEEYLERLTSFAMIQETPEKAIRDKNSESSLLRDPISVHDHAGEDPTKEANMHKQTTRLKNDRMIKGLRLRLEKNNRSLAKGRAEDAKPFKGRPFDLSVGDGKLDVTNRLKAAVDRQLQLCRKLVESENPALKSNVVNFAAHWESKKWGVAVANEYEESLAQSFRKLMNGRAIEVSHNSDHAAGHGAALPGFSAFRTPMDRGYAQGFVTSEKSKSSQLAQGAPSSALAADERSTRLTSSNSDIVRSRQTPNDGALGRSRNTRAIITQPNEAVSAPSHLSLSDRLQRSAAIPENRSTTVSGETIHSGGPNLVRAKKIILRLRLPEGGSTAPRLMIWSQMMARDEFFQKVSERFSDKSVLSVEAFLGEDRILVEPKGSEDEWEIFQEELVQMLSSSSTEKLQVDAVVHVR